MYPEMFTFVLVVLWFLLDLIRSPVHMSLLYLVYVFNVRTVVIARIRLMYLSGSLWSECLYSDKEFFKENVRLLYPRGMITRTFGESNI